MAGFNYEFNPTPVKISTPVAQATYTTVRRALLDLINEVQDADVAAEFGGLAEALGYARAVVALTTESN
jgi:hypothetical protein